MMATFQSSSTRFQAVKRTISMKTGALLGAAVLFTSLVTSVSASAYVEAQVPDCLVHTTVLPINNEQVIQWKSSTANQFRSRANISGTVAKIFPDYTGHHHISVKIGPNPSDLVEVIYNEDFGSIPTYHIGSTLQACGDYITSNAQAGHFPPSPDGAIVHWVHESPNLQRHESGFLVIDGILCGNDPGLAGPKH